MKFGELTQIAMLGTERQSLAAVNAGSALEQLEAQLDPAQRERSLLSLAALSGLHERIGSLATRDSGPVPAACADEAQPRMNERAGSLLSRLLGGDFEELLPEFLNLSAAAGQLAPPENLPALLGRGAAKPKLRDAIFPVLGERGRWLGVQNPEWGWVVGAAADDESVWHTGDRPARLEYLRKVRETQPARAQELLTATWKEEPPEDRAAFIAAFDAGLSLEDEVFLEAALDDKRKEVRRHAAKLLARLPDSALAKRMMERVRPLLRFIPAESGSLLKLKKAKAAALEVTLPTECDKAMQRDGVEPKPAPGRGEKAGWLAQMLAAVPLTTWTGAWGCGVEDIIAASEASEWKAELLEGWVLAAAAQRDAEWAAALFPIALEPGRTVHLEGLLAIVALEDAEDHLLKYFSASFQKLADSPGILPWLRQHQWGGNFSRGVLDYLRALTAAESNDWQFRNLLRDFGCRISPEAFSEAATGWRTDSAGWAFWSKGVEDFLAVVQFRADMHSAFQK